LIWDETKRAANLAKHGLDFAQAGEVLDSRYRLDVSVVRNGEARTLSVSYALGFLAVLTVIHTERDGAARIVSFRRASAIEYEDMTRNEVLAAVRAIPSDKDFVWDGIDDDERPASVEEMQAAIASALKRRGHPVDTGKTQIALCVNNTTLAAFKATGKGWQLRMNEALDDWIKTHSSA
jgi:uncharacterized DUF497 family protein/uncharacterized protein (DUF4415 family)